MKHFKIFEGKIKVKGNGYWDDEGTYQDEYTRMEDEYIPTTGPSKDKPWGELFRCVTGIAYDWYNNGFGNDKRIEFAYVNKNEKLFKKFLRDKNSFQDLYTAWNQEVLPDIDPSEDEEYDGDDPDYEFENMIDQYDPQINLWLNDILDAVIQSMLAAGK